MSNSFHITIGTHPQNNLKLHHDIRLIKTSLLYADKITLCSPTATLLGLTSQISSLEDEQLLELLRVAASYQQNRENVDQVIKIYKDSKNKSDLSDKEVVSVLFMNKMMQQLREGLTKKIEELAEQAGGQEFIKAINTGLVDLQPLPADLKELTDSFIQFVSNTVTLGDTYPLFDDQTGQIVRLSLNEGLINIPDISVAKGKHIGLSTNFLNRLPNLESVSITQINHLRRELEKPLVLFRSKMISYSEKVKNAQWDKDFPLEAEMLFIQEVEPAIQQIAEEFKANRYIRKLIKNSVQKQLYPLSNIGVLLSTVGGLVDITHAAYGILASTAVSSLDTYYEWRQEQEKIQRNQLYFYYRAEHNLRKNK